MLEIVNLSMLLLPLLPLTLLLVAMSDAQRRNGLYCLASTLSSMFIWASFVNWILRDSGLVLFEGWVGAVLHFLLYNIWAIATYGLLIAITGHFANRYALRRIRSRNARFEMSAQTDI